MTGAESQDHLPGPLLMLPFTAQLLAIALMPFLAPHWWERNYPKVSVALGGITVSYYLIVLHGGMRLLVTLHEYGSFILLLASLFVVSGGIHISIEGRSTPHRNTLFLLFGAVLSNLIGTTGASMILIRPWIRMNKNRFAEFHAVFFIFIISNVGGALTPIGDPPLFLGFLKGVPFFWTIMHLWQPWMMVNALLAGIFYLLDLRNFVRVSSKPDGEEIHHESGWSVEGWGNLLPLGAIISAVFLPSPWREAVMVTAALLSWHQTPATIHRRNDFSFAPIREVTWLFLGIFATMIPALDYLEHHAPSLAASIGMGPLHFYLCTGLLSSVLDNAPTYLAFLSVELGLKGGSLGNPEDVLRVALTDPCHLVAISLGAVFFGALTYVGNGPNFMVKSIISESGAKAPGFFSYILRYALPILIPVLALAGWIFLG
jgi:Na+/H+ antiporter NhaD/arsenite permease-like protein